SPAQENRARRRQDCHRQGPGLLPRTGIAQRHHRRMISGKALASMLIDPKILKDTSTQAAGGGRVSGLFRRRRGNRALLNKIMVWMFGPLFLLWTIGLVITYFIAQNIANAPY